jgi:hypothetical protein
VTEGEKERFNTVVGARAKAKKDIKGTGTTAGRAPTHDDTGSCGIHF